jgi:predicted MFS family arabinose efflux permease
MATQDDGISANASEKAEGNRMFIPSLAVAGFAVAISAPMLSLLTVDIAASFSVPVGVAAQLSTVNNAAEVIFALLMGALAIRFRHKSLLLIGTLLVIVSAIVGFFAPTLTILQLAFALEGGGTVMVNVMSFTLIGEFMPAQRKAKAVSYIMAIINLAALVGNPLIVGVTNVGGWRSVFMFLVLPISTIGLLLSTKSLPSFITKNKGPIQPVDYLKSFKQVLSNRSASACLLGFICAAAGNGSFGVFAIAYYREYFLVSRDATVLIMLAVSGLFIVSALFVGYIINRIGAKKISVIGMLLTSVFGIAFFLAPTLETALTFNMFQAWFFSFAATAFSCLVLDQVPQSRGTMLSLKSVSGSIGSAIGAAVGGALLVLFSYQAVGWAFGGICAVSAVIYLLFTKDPPKEICGY